MDDRDAVDAVRHAALWFTPSQDGLAPLLDLIGDARIVLIGEATHGTEEFYRIRANLTSALINTKQFNLDAVGEMLARLIADHVTARHEKHAVLAREEKPACLGEQPVAVERGDLRCRQQQRFNCHRSPLADSSG